MTGRPPLPSVLAELLQDPAVVKWLRWRDAQTVARTVDAVVDIVVEVARHEGASPALTTAIREEAGCHEKVEQVARDVLGVDRPAAVLYEGYANVEP